MMYVKVNREEYFPLGCNNLIKPTFVAERWFFCVLMEADYAKKDIYLL